MPRKNAPTPPAFFLTMESRCDYATRLCAMLDSMWESSSTLPTHIAMPREWLGEIVGGCDSRLAMAERVACGDILALVGNLGFDVVAFLDSFPGSNLIFAKLERVA